jgi:hypothetical protein
MSRCMIPAERWKGAVGKELKRKKVKGRSAGSFYTVRRESGGGPVHASFSLPIRGEPALFYVASVAQQRALPGCLMYKVYNGRSHDTPTPSLTAHLPKILLNIVN